MTENWKRLLLERLKSRNRKERTPFEGLIQSHCRLFDSAASLKSKNVQLTIETEKLREENRLAPKVDGGGGGGSNPAVEQKLFKLQEELTELHRKRGENTQQIIDLNSALQEKEKELQAKESRVNDSLATELALKSEIKNLEATIMELEATNQMLKDEHQALQLAFTGLEEKYMKAKQDNQELLERWLDQKSKIADKLNAENDSFMRKQQEKLKKDLHDAAEEPVNILPQGQVGIFVPGTVPVCLSASLPNKVQYKFDSHDSDVNAIRWSPSGHLFATGGADRKIKLWEVRNGKCECKGILTGSNAGIMALDFDLEVITQCILSFTMKSSCIPEMMSEPSVASFFSGTGGPISTRFITPVTLGPLDSLILGASNDFASRVWTLADQRLRHTLTGHSGKVLAAKFLGDANKVVSGSHDRTLKIWDLHSRACIKTIFAGSSCNDLVTSHGSNIISGHFDKRVRFWDSRSDSSTNEILMQGRITSLDMSPDRTMLLCCTRDDTIKILDLRRSQVSNTLCAEDFKVGCDWSRAVFSPDGTYALAGSSDGGIYIWNIKSGKVEKCLKEHSHSVIACSWHPVGSYILSCEKQRKTILWSDI